MDGDGNDLTKYYDSGGNVVGNYMIRICLQNKVIYLPANSTTLAGQTPVTGQTIMQSEEEILAVLEPGASRWITAFAEEERLHEQTLRMYERQGFLTPARVSGKNRLYSRNDVQAIDAGFNRVPSSRSIVSADATGDTVTVPNHNFVAGDQVEILNSTGGGVSNGIYYVFPIDSNTLRLFQGDTEETDALNNAERATFTATISSGAVTGVTINNPLKPVYNHTSESGAMISSIGLGPKIGTTQYLAFCTSPTSGARPEPTRTGAISGPGGGAGAERGEGGPGNPPEVTPVSD